MTQTEMILAHLQSGKPITPLEALREYGCFRLGARIWDLKQAGHPIEMTLANSGDKHFASYRLVEKERSAA